MFGPSYPISLGFKSGASGTHTSRTLMYEELAAVLTVAAPRAERPDLVRAIVEDNVLGKTTASTRRISAQRLTELYALDPSAPIFRALHRLWVTDAQSRPLLALLSALARDPMLRATASSVLALREGQSFDRDAANSALRQHAGARLNDAILDKVVRNAAASWTQSGHLVGRTFKKRQRVTATPASVTMALFLGYLQGLRGPALFTTLWCEVLDSSPEALSALASRAAQSDLLRFRQSGDVIEIGFPSLLSKAENELTSHGQN